jgi:hypothetical protein
MESHAGVLDCLPEQRSPTHRERDKTREFSLKQPFHLPPLQPQIRVYTASTAHLNSSAAFRVLAGDPLEARRDALAVGTHLERPLFVWRVVQQDVGGKAELS